MDLAHLWWRLLQLQLLEHNLLTKGEVKTIGSR